MNMNDQYYPEDYLFMDYLYDALSGEKYKIDYNGDKHMISLDEKLDILVKVMNKTEHSTLTVYHILVIVQYPQYFTFPIEDNLAGFGENPEDAMKMGVQNFMSTLYPTLTAILNEVNTSEDFTMQMKGQDVLVHTLCGPIQVQGKFPPDFKIYHNTFYSILEDKLRSKLQPIKINWIKIYAAISQTGFTGECIINGEYWNEGLKIVENYANTWGSTTNFMAQKQFMMFRTCDEYDYLFEKQ